MTTTTRPPIRLLIADDHHFYRQSLAKICQIKGGFEIVGHASNGYEAVQQARCLKPDIILMDLCMPIVDGVEATRVIKEIEPRVRIIILTAYRQDAYLFEAIKAGAQGYLFKDVDIHDLREAIEAVYRGETLLDAALTTRLFCEVRNLNMPKT